MDNPNEHYRASAYELNLEVRINNLNQAVQMLGSALKAALPTAPVPEISGIIYGSPHLSYYSQMGDEAFLAGRGPRFVSLYNLADSVNERKALLDKLQPSDNGFRHSGLYTGLSELTQNYSFASTSGNCRVNEPADEFVNWLSKARENNAFEPIQGNDLRVVGIACSRITRRINQDWTTEVRDEIRTFSYVPAPRENRDYAGRLIEPTVFAPVEFVAIPVPSACGLVLVAINVGNNRVEPQFLKWVVWNEIEGKWCMTDGAYFSHEWVQSVTERLLDFVGMPKLDLPSTEEVIDACAKLFDLVQAKREELGSDLEAYGRLSHYTLTLPGVFTLSFQARRSWDSWYDQHDRIHYQLLEEQFTGASGYAPELQACSMSNRELVPLVRMEEDDYGKLVLKGSLSVSLRQKRNLIDRFNQFTSADPATLVVVETLNEDYRPPATAAVDEEA